MGISESLKISRLNSAKKDLMDDGSAISSIRNKVQNLQDGFDAVIIKAPGKGSVYSKLEQLKEPDQYSDRDLSNAAYYIEQEIQALQRDAEQKKQNDGGGGSW